MKSGPHTAPPTEPSVLVVGAGAGGLGAAISLAKGGVRVCLVEQTARLGGTVARSLIHTIGGLFDSEGEFSNPGLPVELAERLAGSSPYTARRRMGRLWTLNAAPDAYERAVEAWLAEEPLITVLREATIDTIAREGSRITRVRISRGNDVFWIAANAAVDATGEADIVRSIDPRLVFVEAEAAGGLVFTLQPVDTSALQFPRNIELLRAMREAAHHGVLPEECDKAWLDVGVYEHEAYVKLFVRLGGNWRNLEVRRELWQRACQQRDLLLAFLRKLPPFADAELKRTGDLGIRHGGTVTGNYRLTASDVRQARRFPDAAAACSWPIEFWDPEKGVTLEYLPKGAAYDVPMGSLEVRGWDNLWVAGKCLSADPHAQASARVAGCCWAMGDAVGRRIAAQL